MSIVLNLGNSLGRLQKHGLKVVYGIYTKNNKNTICIYILIYIISISGNVVNAINTSSVPINKHIYLLIIFIRLS